MLRAFKLKREVERQRQCSELIVRLTTSYFVTMENAVYHKQMNWYQDILSLSLVLPIY